MKLHEARYAGDHPIVRDIKQALKFNRGYETVIQDEKDSRSAIKEITRAFGEPVRRDIETPAKYGLVLWDIPPDNTLQILFGQGAQTTVELF